ncbi:MAG: 2-oxo acid dehydrogenase subunit E2, partial [Kiloniellales bacterium]
FVPIMRDVGNRDEANLRRGLDALKKDAAARQIPVAELRGATISLSNFGMFGAGQYAALVVVPPQVAIIGAGRIAARLCAAEGKPAVRRMMPLSLTFDHRVVTGGEAARFLAAMIEDLARRG